MTAAETKLKVRQLQDLSVENELVEFKEAKHTYDFAKLGQYFSALSNEANLFGKKCAWLVFGIENKSHAIVGSLFRTDKADLHSLKKEIADQTTNRITFREIYEVIFPEGRVVLFQIPPAPKGFPVAFKGHYYGRDGESLAPLNLEELERIRVQGHNVDWTAVIIPEATVSDLDGEAIARARVEFAKRNPKYATEMAQWDDVKFLDKTKLTIKGKVTRAAMILLGKEEEEHFLGSTVKIRWNLKTLKNEDKDFEVFSIPLLLAVDKVYAKIRNLNYRYIRDNTLFPEEFLRYDPFNIREPLNNAIAHQDYSAGARINVVEFEDDHLVFSNYGAFLPNKPVEKIVLEDSPEEKYRNPFLVEAMKNLDMIETQGGGIRKIFTFQKARGFPLPEYDFSGNKVKVTIVGKVMDNEFARILIKNPSLGLDDILMLDKVQKRKSISAQEYAYLKKRGFIEGRRTNFYLSFRVVEPVDDEVLRAEYMANRSFDDAHFKDMILEYVNKFGKTKRSAIDKLIIPKLSAALSDDQKKNKVTNFLTALRKEDEIRSTGYGIWEPVLKEF